MKKKIVIALAVLALVSLVPSLFAETLQRVKIGDVRPFSAESKHPYGSGNEDRSPISIDLVTSPEAKFVRVHFSAFDLADGDFVSVSNPQGSQFWAYTLKGPNGTGKFWSFAVDGDTAIVRIHAGPGSTGFGYIVDKVGHGAAKWEDDQIHSQVVCGTDGRQDIACQNVGDSLQRPVTRMLFQSGPSMYVCTGWLVAGSNNSTMLTNNHCISTQTEASSLQAKFNFQRSSCGGSTNAGTTDYAGGTLLKTNNKLDYTIMTLQGNPEATWGELTATTKKATAGSLIYFIQHPGGNEKEIGYWEDSAKTVRCKVDRIDQTYSGTTRKSQMAYGCDSEGGSSGSPILDATTGRAIGLHHYGGVSSSPCLNAATEMPEICSNAGTLLNCASN